MRKAVVEAIRSGALAFHGNNGEFRVPFVYGPSDRNVGPSDRNVGGGVDVGFRPRSFDPLYGVFAADVAKGARVSRLASVLAVWEVIRPIGFDPRRARLGDRLLGGINVRLRFS